MLTFIFNLIIRYKLDIQPELHVLDANSPNTLEMKVLKHQLLRLRDQVVPVRNCSSISLNLNTFVKI